MKKYYDMKVTKNVEGEDVEIGFSKDGNKHLYSDAGFRSKVFQKSDLLDLPAILERAEYVKRLPLLHKRKDHFASFIYFKANLHGEKAYINVGEMINNNGKIVKRIAYSLTDKIK